MTESPRRNILEMYRSLFTGLDFFFPFPLLGTSVHISFTFSNTMLQCLGEVGGDKDIVFLGGGRAGGTPRPGEVWGGLYLPLWGHGGGEAGRETERDQGKFEGGIKQEPEEPSWILGTPPKGEPAVPEGCGDTPAGPLGNLGTLGGLRKTVGTPEGFRGMLGHTRRDFWGPWGLFGGPGVSNRDIGGHGVTRGTPRGMSGTREIMGHTKVTQGDPVGQSGGDLGGILDNPEVLESILEILV